MTEEGGGNGGKKKKEKEKERIDCTLGTNRVSTLVFRSFFFFFSYVEKCVSATNGPLKKPKQI